MENKVQFKLHKVKIQWVTIAVSGLAFCASLIGVSVSADEQATNPLSSANTAESVSQNPDLVVTETTVATTKLIKSQPIIQLIQLLLLQLISSQSLKKTNKQVALTIWLASKQELLLQIQK